MKLWHSFDWLLFLLTFILILFSSAILISIDSFRLPQQLVYLTLGFFCFFFVSRLDYRIFKNFDLIFYFLSLALLVITFLVGSPIRGATRWLKIGFLSFQPSEILKPLVILSLGNLALKLDLKKLKNSFFFFLIFAPLFFLIFKQPDLGNTFVYFLIFLSVFYAAGGSLLFLFFAFLSAFLFSPLAWHFLREYQRQRIISFLNPMKDPLGIGYNLIQSVVTVGSGYLWGRGLGIGTQSKLNFLPERATDFIFASLAEQLGFVGCLILLLIFLFLLLKIYLTGVGCKDNFGKNVAFGIFFMIFSQTLINIGMNLGLMPITGVTLPLVSQGGSSLIAMMITLGLVGSISSSRKRTLF